MNPAQQIRAHWRNATAVERTEGASWYACALAECTDMAHRYGCTVQQAVLCVTALSPGNEWTRNLQDARDLLAAWQSGASADRWPLVGIYGRRNVRKCASILLDGVTDTSVLWGPRGPKCRAFAACILSAGQCQAVVIDRHAKCAALNIREARDSVGIVTPREYRELAETYRTVAASIGVAPPVLQATVWVRWKDLIG